jgi:hypothetical protein
LPRFQKQLAEYLDRLRVISEEIYSVEPLSKWKTRLEEERSTATSYQAKLAEFEKRIASIDLETIREQLNIVKADIAERYSRMGLSLSLFLSIVLPTGIWFLFKRAFGDEKGEKKVISIRGDFRSLLDFIKNNKYSF